MTASSASVTGCAPPSLSTDSPHEGKAVSVTAGTCTVPPSEVTFAWSRCDDFGAQSCVNVAGNVTSYTPVQADVGKWLLVVQTTSDPLGTEQNSDITANAVNGNPTADFTFTSPVRANQPATYSATSTDPEGDVITNDWDMDNDGAFDDASGSSVSWAFFTPGSHTVSLRSTDPGGDGSITTKVVSVKGPPVADFTTSPQNPRPGETMQLTSTSTDPDNDALSYAWELDGDGDFNDATGPNASATFAKAGDYRVGLRVTADGETAIKSITVLVREPAATPPGPTGTGNGTGKGNPTVTVPKGPLGLLSPFPIITIAGRATSGGARLTRLTIRAPRGSLVKVVCHGRGCPYRRARRRAADGRVRFRRLQRRLPAGTIIEVFVSRPGSIGKYTRFTIRAGRPPARRDRCVQPGASKPSTCPNQ